MTNVARHTTLTQSTTVEDSAMGVNGLNSMAIATNPAALDDAVMLLLVIWLFPVTILLFGTPVVLLVRLLVEIAQGM